MPQEKIGSSCPVKRSSTSVLGAHEAAHREAEGPGMGGRGIRGFEQSWGDSQVTIGFNSKLVIHDLDDLVYFHFRNTSFKVQAGTLFLS